MGGFNFVLGLDAMAEMARAIGNSTLEKRYATLAETARTAFHTDFYDPKLRAYVSRQLPHSVGMNSAHESAKPPLNASACCDGISLVKCVHRVAMTGSHRAKKATGLCSPLALKSKDHIIQTG